MPELCRCSQCDKETYLGQANCPHCGSALVPKAEAPAEVYQPDPSYEEMKQGVAAGSLAIRLRETGTLSQDAYRLVPKVYARGMMIRFLVIPVLVIGGFLAPFFIELEFGLELPEGRSGSTILGTISVVPALLLSLFLLRRRSVRMLARIEQDPSSYAAAMQHGLIVVEPTGNLRPSS